MSEPKPYTIKVTWRRIDGTDPVLCDALMGCGHQHPAWQKYEGSAKAWLAPQWGWCVEEDCKCASLRTSATDPSRRRHPTVGIQP